MEDMEIMRKKNKIKLKPKKLLRILMKHGSALEQSGCHITYFIGPNFDKGPIRDAYQRFGREGHELFGRLHGIINDFPGDFAAIRSYDVSNTLENLFKCPDDLMIYVLGYGTAEQSTTFSFALDSTKLTRCYDKDHIRLETGFLEVTDPVYKEIEKKYYVDDVVVE